MIICKGNKMAVKVGAVQKVSNGKPFEVATESEMTAILNNATLADDGRVYVFTGTTGTYTNGAYYVLKYTL